MHCPSCGGKSETCKTCEGNGRGIRVTGCPMSQVGGEVWSLMEMARFADKGLLPVSGGVCDQSQSFLDGYRLIGHLKALRKNASNG
jgi:hypothetical protein